MRIRSALPLMALLALSGHSGVALAQGAPAAAPAAPTRVPPAPLTKAQIEDVAFEMRVLVSALQSDKVDGNAKEALSQCIFNNAFSKISEEMGKVIAQNAGKVDKRNADQILFIMVRVCGYDPQKAAAAAKPGAAPATSAAKPAAKPAAAKPAVKAPQGR